MDEFARTCEDIARVASKLKKVERLANYLRGLGDADFNLAVQFFSNGPSGPATKNQTLFETDNRSRLAVSRVAIREALQMTTHWQPDIMRLCFAQTGDSGETAGLLLRGIAADEPMSLAQASDLYQQLGSAITANRQRDLLVSVYRRFRPKTIKYFIKVITRGLRIGLMSRMTEEAVALSCSVSNESIRDANNRLGDLAKVALAARHGTLSGIETRLFHPMDFMLAKPLDRLEDLSDPANWWIEDKFDGIRSQVHFDNGHVRVFSRGMEELTNAFPEIVDAWKTISGRGIIDGEILAWRDNRALNFNLLQQRIARKSVRAYLLSEVPVIFVAYDVLLKDDNLLLAAPIEERRRVLETILHQDYLSLKLSSQTQASSHSEIDQLFLAARASGNEGLLLKRKGSPYEPGKRGGAWQKVKRPYGTLDVVITAAEQGHGRRAIYFSDYTFGVRAGEGYANIGKAYSGLTDVEVKDLTRILRSASTEKFGRVILVEPKVVLEVAFDGVQKSARHKGGYALRFPRILRWRKDKNPQQIDDIHRVEELYRNSLL